MLLGMLTCKEALERLDDYLDRELSAEEIQRVQSHLKICRACTRKFASEANFIQETRRKLDRLALPPDLMGRISETLSQAQQEETK